MTAAEIRQSFLDFFVEKGHTIVPSASLLPQSPGLLFTNAGMNQFVPYFLGTDKAPYNPARATDTQKCIRAGGKHNDLDDVGQDSYHHTFFEMLGNFSFGDYFKHDAIHYAWEFLTSDKWLNLPQEKLWVTVYASDDEAYDIWTKEVGVPAERMVRIGDNKGAPYASDNFWAMGDTGPCGPCTEIFFDHGADIWGGPPGSPEEDGDRYIEIWNNVFMQFNRTADGEMHPLPAPSVDTGMGLERISAVMQHVHANYEIDLFQNLLAAAAEAIGCAQDNAASLKVVADHIRSCSFLIADGVLPSNEGRGYVLRRIIRRACRHGNKLGAKGVFFHKIVAALAAEMGDAFPELKTQQAHIERVLKTEEEQFAKTLDQGLRILEQDLAELKGSEIPGDVVFKLYDTYGFPVDLTGDIARERELTIDEAGFEAAMEAQRERARSASQFGLDYNALVKVDIETHFQGYDGTEGQGSVVALFRDGEQVEALNEGEKGVAVLDQTPFYAESGGQVGDTGFLRADGVQAEVSDTTKAGNAHLHHVVVQQGSLRVGEQVAAQVDASVRQATALNHSATPIHETGLQLLQTGRLASGGQDFPSFGSVTSRVLGPGRPVPAAVVLPRRIDATGVNVGRGQGAAFLGSEFEPTEINGQVPEVFRVDQGSGSPAALPGLKEDVFASESETTRRAYGETRFGRLCCRARQMVERGVAVVTVNLFDRLHGQVTWDAHAAGEAAPGTLFDYRDTLCPQFDQATSALLDDLQGRGLWEDTLVVASGEFGRTPKLNSSGGRDHWTGAWSAMLAGGAVPGGQVVGATDASAGSVTDSPVDPAELTATIYRHLGIDPRMQLVVEGGSTMPLIEADPVEALISA